MELSKTSVQLDKKILADLRVSYPHLTPSQIIRAALEYLHQEKPLITRNDQLEFKRGQNET